MKKIIFLAVLSLLFSGVFASVVKADVSVQSPATFTLKVNEKATVTNVLDMQIKLVSVGMSSVTNWINPPSTVAEINVSTSGGCGPNADPRCLGMPAFNQDYSLAKGGSASALGLAIKLKDTSSDSATIEISFSVSNTEPDSTVSITPDGTTTITPGVVGGSEPGYSGGSDGSGDSGVPVDPISPPGSIFCTQEAKICPDGSYVSRTGPNCEFAACPGGSVLPPSTFSLPDGQEIVSTERIEATPETSAYYEVKTKKKARLFFLIPVRPEITYSVNSETGASRVISRPWWNFLAW